MTVTGHGPNRRAFLGMTAATLALPSLARAGGATLERIGGAAFGTSWSVAAPAGQGLELLRPALTEVLAQVDRQMSPWRADSEITAVNLGVTGRHEVSPDTARVTAGALHLAEESGGAFDPTVGPLVARWGFGPIAGEAGADWRDLSVSGSVIGKARAGATVDLCGIAKGFALDRMAEVIRAAGHRSAIIDLGGELRGIGQHPAGRPWQVAVEDPRGTGDAAAILALPDVAVATSGLLTQSYRIGAEEYGHIVDAPNHRPATGALRSVSVAAEDGMLADGWATALFAAGAEAGPGLARRRGVSALFLVECDGVLVQDMTGNMPGLLL